MPKYRVFYLITRYEYRKDMVIEATNRHSARKKARDQLMVDIADGDDLDIQDVIQVMKDNKDAPSIR